eukprot:CAMPEP_0177628568 /NCGR_PEP_ID=MMETSP0447-20121125/201_1 /TAXON_ID=0 /ORGANISM="Stygamoeba regulata, Strain BSH-02190019" /LENGTH=50 /DNA_ID=CAMNT_0019129825 /DNA_START=14 /DNA_END=163 /DNA_ORIENTATION=-
METCPNCGSLHNGNWSYCLDCCMSSSSSSKPTKAAKPEKPAEPSSTSSKP